MHLDYNNVSKTICLAITVINQSFKRQTKQLIQINKAALLHLKLQSCTSHKHKAPKSRLLLPEQVCSVCVKNRVKLLPNLFKNKKQD